MSRPVRNPHRCPAHPGQVLREIALPALGFSKTRIAAHLGISRQALYDLLGEKHPVTPQMAVRIGKLLGNNPLLWLNMQAAYDLWHASRDVDVSSIPTLKAGSELPRH
ncbi:MAG: HigA family addiction module antitoxin [Hyphomicrobiales bacterium]